MIRGRKVILVPATLGDKPRVYAWCFNSETTKSHAGPPPDYPHTPIPSFEEFYSDYVDYCFTGAQPQNGRGFIIQHGGESVGLISYCSYHMKPNKSEFDIWMNSETHCGKGLGSDALCPWGNFLIETWASAN